MIETFVRLVDGRIDSASTSSVWQGTLTFQTNISINQLVTSTIQAAGRAAAHIDPQANNWRFLLYNHKFGEYCDTNSRDKRAICDGDKFQLIYVSKNVERLQSGHQRWVAANRQSDAASVIAEVHNQTPLVFLDEEDEDIKPSIDTLIRATTSSILTAANQAIEAEQQTNNRESRRGSRRHLPSDLIRQLKNDYDDDELEDEEEEEEISRSPSPGPKSTSIQQQENGVSSRKRPKLNNNEYESDDEFKPKPSPQYRRNSSIVSEKSNGDRLEDGPCLSHTHAPEQCSHTKFKNVNALAILNSASSGQAILEHLESLNHGNGANEIEHGIRCKLMNAIGTFLMHNADNVGLPTAVERRILVSSFLAQLPCQIDTTVFTNRGGTGCLDYWVRNRRKTTMRPDGVYMVRGSKNRSQRKRNSNY